MRDKIIKMVEMELDLDQALYDELIVMAKKEIVKDNDALINYIVNKALQYIVDNEKEFNDIKKSKVVKKAKKKVKKN